ncbi:hypothetical protein J1605_006886 [Eschrichtius robustus]|uniref:Protein BANP n=1 Tax=Eschrichtius robustus TaxID=9764 RepID=A0AB34H2Q1_ESCRO|nr:hypothetical protein J1605_006886 [Eschrichtius robustus]
MEDPLSGRAPDPLENIISNAVPGRRQNTIVVKVPGQEDSHNEDGESGSEASDSVSNCGQSGSQSIGSNVTLITLNSEEDYPNGTWLGDENNPEMRVRCAIIPSDMLHISTNCRTAEKMALTLLDYLFHREVQAVSNLSGQGKHGKKQLDPLTIYGIRCKCGRLCLPPPPSRVVGRLRWGGLSRASQGHRQATRLVPVPEGWGSGLPSLVVAGDLVMLSWIPRMLRGTRWPDLT